MTRNLEREIENAARELAERYEEINLLYSISEILGRTVSLEEATSIILREVSDTVGARRGAILLREEGTEVLHVVATTGIDAAAVPDVSLSAPDLIPAQVFRTRHPVVIDPSDTSLDDGFRIGGLLTVPIIWTSPAGRAELLGTMSLTDRRSRQPFSAGDIKLVVAVATQIGSAIQNARLVRASIEQQRLLQELELAHDLQMKLLPRTSVVSPQAEVAARVEPAESVGGDFYHLFRLTPTETGVMIGDVSSHGYRAALIMALTLSAASIHAQSTLDPGAMLHALLDSLREELSTTEMFVTVFYGVVDKAEGTVRYANTGHPHAFLFRANGEVQRLSAIDPPLGMTDGAPGADTAPWKSGEDLLVLFTDGIPDACNRLGKRLGESYILDLVKRHRAESPAFIVDRLFEAVRKYTGDVPILDDMTFLVLKS